MAASTPDKHNITGWILAGGQGLRMGGADKGLQLFQEQPLALRALQRLQTQVNTVCINANRHVSTYQTFGADTVYPDEDQESFAGPLMGFLTGLKNCPTEWLLTVPCDSPFFPLDLSHRLAKAADEQQSLLAMAQAPETNQLGTIVLKPQPVFCLLHTSLQNSLEDFLNQGGRKIDAWTSQHQLALVDFNQASDSPNAFANANSWEDLQKLQA